MAKRSAKASLAPGRFWQSVWAFPVVLFVLVLLLAALRISGSSVGVYHQTFYGSAHDSNLLYAQPRPIRSDEWLVATTLTVAQSRHNYAMVNPSIGQGLDTSVIFDVPYREWSTIFRPQNLPFFALPLEPAFAMKWWLLDFSLAVGGYFFVLSFLPSRRRLAVLLGLGLVLSPFVQWWYQTITVAPLAYSLILVSLFVASLRAETTRMRVVLGAALAYFLACFALVLYPPFQIPCAIVAAAVGIGYLLEQKEPKVLWKKIGKLVIPTLCAALVAAAFVAAFWVTRESTIKAVENSVYPGHRVVVSGGFGLLHLFDGFIDHQLQFETATQHYQLNQSEASNFVYLWPFLMLPSLLLSYKRWKKQKVIEYAPLFVNAVLLLFAAVLFLPLPEIVLHLVALSLVPHNRLLIGFGLANFALIVLFLRQLEQTKLPSRVPLIFGALCFALLWADGLLLHLRHPWLLPGIALFTVLALVVAAAVYLLLQGRAVAAAALLLLLGLFSVYRVHPLYQGLGLITHSRIEQAIAQTPQARSGVWIDLDDLATVNLLAATGVHTYSDTYSYPQLSLWHEQDPSGLYNNVYNRYGFAIFTTQKLTGPFEARGADSFFVGYNPCSSTEFDGAIQHVLAQKPVNSPCLMLQSEVKYPAQTFYIYKPVPAS